MFNALEKALVIKAGDYPFELGRTGTVVNVYPDSLTFIIEYSYNTYHFTLQLDTLENYLLPESQWTSLHKLVASY